MDIQNKTTKQLRALLKQFSIVSLSLDEVILKNAIEDELYRRSNNV